jgi:NAD(P)H-flavin reductase
LLYGNKAKEDILLREQLERLKERLNIEIKFFVEIGETDGNIYQGLINKDVVKSYCEDDKLFVLCGSKSMIGFYLKPMLIDLGVKEENILAF